MKYGKSKKYSLSRAGSDEQISHCKVELNNSDFISCDGTYPFVLNTKTLSFELKYNAEGYINNKQYFGSEIETYHEMVYAVGKCSPL